MLLYIFREKSFTLNFPLFLFIAIVSGALVSCFNEEIPLKEKSEALQLGKQLQNPFSVKNMLLAYEKLKKAESNGRIQETSIRTTHLYIKIAPRNWNEYDALRADSSIYYEDYPIDYEIIQQGTYHDPLIPDSLPTFQYTSVPLNYQIPNEIEYEILEELYLPKEDSLLTDASGRMSPDIEEAIDLLEYEAFRLTNNLPRGTDQKPGPNGKISGLLPSKFTPSGNVKVRDTRLGIIPFNGIKVRTRRWFEVHEAITDASGNYRASGTYRYDFNYNLIYERADFDVRTGTFGQATLDGPNCKCSWSPTIDGGVHQFYASVFRGAFRYFYLNIDGLRRPRAWDSKIKISAYDTNGDTNGVNWGNWDGFGIIPDIQIWRIVNGRTRDTDEVLSTTIHEIAHTTHIQEMNAGLIQFSQVSDVIIESWAVAVQWHLTSIEYRERGFFNYGAPNFFNGIEGFRMNFGYQYWNSNLGNEYTSLFIDITDNFNQLDQTFVSGLTRIGTVNDPVSGYSLQAIESGFLKHVYGLSSLREKLKQNKPGGVTDDQIDVLMNNF